MQKQEQMHASPVFECNTPILLPSSAIQDTSRLNTRPASSLCKPSPDGRFIATLDSLTVTIRSTRTLRITNVVKLGPRAGSSSAALLVWAPSSAKLLVSTADQIDVFAASRRKNPFLATIRSPLSGSGRPSAIHFGARDTEVLVWPASGLKLVIFHLSSSPPKVVEIANPKFYQHAWSALRGVSLHPRTGHLALLTRTGGKDLISLHHPVSRMVQRSWSPDTVDAQGLTWTPDGRWLLIWESPTQGHGVLLYTADGQHFRTIGAADMLAEPNADLQSGVKLCQPSADSRLSAVGDHSRGIAVIDTESWRTSLRLLHPTVIVPRDTLQVWQEQITASAVEGRSTHAFVRATQPLSPPGAPADSKMAVARLKPGCSLAAFDSSSTLLAARLDDSPCAVWIWDVAAAELRAVLIFHVGVTFEWHPSCRELLLVTYQDVVQQQKKQQNQHQQQNQQQNQQQQHGMAFVWDPLSNGPTAVAPEDHLPDGKTVGKTQVSWVEGGVEFPVLLISNAQHYVMLSLLSSDQCPNPWQQAIQGHWGEEGEVQEEEVQEEEEEELHHLMVADDMDQTSVLDDTFSFKRVR